MNERIERDLVRQKTSIIVMICIIVMVGMIGFTYSFFAAEISSSSGQITGEVATPELNITVQKIAPASPNANKKLIPQLDSAITKAVLGTQGKCVDDNTNAVCQVYKITLKNVSASSINVDGVVELENGNNPNLKWARISGDGTSGEPEVIDGIKEVEQTSLTVNELYTKGETKEYYIVVWISETGYAQMDRGTFTGTVRFNNHSETQNAGSNDIIKINSTNATATYDYIRKSVLISNTSAIDEITFSLTETTNERTYFNDYIISLLGTNTTVLAESTTGNGSTLEKINSTSPLGTSTDYRYRGIEPANYVMFNDELWRIIGVFDSNSHNVKDANNESVNLVKLIRDDSIGGYVWDNDTTVSSNGSNNYVNSDINKILNTAYYNHIDATGQDYCYAFKSSLPGKCNFTKKGIQEEYQEMVEEGVTWYLGGNTSTVSAPNYYNYERTSTNVYSGNTPSIVAPIGLMYASDYGYAAPSACTDTSTSSFNSTNITLGTSCAAQDWLKSNYYEWTITHHSSNSYPVSYVYPAGYLSSNNAYNGYATRPVLYLESSVYYLSGTGTQTDPYIIAMD